MHLGELLLKLLADPVDLTFCPRPSLVLLLAADLGDERRLVCSDLSGDLSGVGSLLVTKHTDERRRVGGCLVRLVERAVDARHQGVGLLQDVVGTPQVGVGCCHLVGVDSLHLLADAALLGVVAGDLHRVGTRHHRCQHQQDGPQVVLPAVDGSPGSCEHQQGEEPHDDQVLGLLGRGTLVVLPDLREERQLDHHQSQADANPPEGEQVPAVERGDEGDHDAEHHDRVDRLEHPEQGVQRAVGPLEHRGHLPLGPGDLVLRRVLDLGCLIGALALVAPEPTLALVGRPLVGEALEKTDHDDHCSFGDLDCFIALSKNCKSFLDVARVLFERMKNSC